MHSNILSLQILISNITRSTGSTRNIIYNGHRFDFLNIQGELLICRMIRWSTHLRQSMTLLQSLTLGCKYSGGILLGRDITRMIPESFRFLPQGLSTGLRILPCFCSGTWTFIFFSPVRVFLYGFSIGLSASIGFATSVFNPNDIFRNLLISGTA